MNPKQVTLLALERGTGVLVLGVLIALVVSALAFGLMRLRGRGRSSRRILSRLLFWVLSLLSLAAALTIVFPSINPVDVLGGLGVISVAAGIAFQTVLGNLFAGIVILARDRFRVGDQVKVGDTGGSITEIHLSSTTIRTFDGQMVLVPNTIMHSSMVTIQTGYERIRTTVEVDLSSDADLARAKQIAEDTMNAQDVVLTDPKPRALYTEIGTESVKIALQFWSGSTKLEMNEATDTIIQTVMAAFKREGIPLATTGLEALTPQTQLEDDTPAPENQILAGATAAPSAPKGKKAKKNAQQANPRKRAAQNRSSATNRAGAKKWTVNAANPKNTRLYKPRRFGFF